MSYPLLGTQQMLGGGGEWEGKPPGPRAGKRGKAWVGRIREPGCGVCSWRGGLLYDSPQDAILPGLRQTLERRPGRFRDRMSVKGLRLGLNLLQERGVSWPVTHRYYVLKCSHNIPTFVEFWGAGGSREGATLSKNFWPG